jgi:hypothetical protein
MIRADGGDADNVSAGQVAGKSFGKIVANPHGHLAPAVIGSVGERLK